MHPYGGIGGREGGGQKGYGAKDTDGEESHAEVGRDGRELALALTCAIATVPKQSHNHDFVDARDETRRSPVLLPSLLCSLRLAED